jgi:glycosyltransferase involved in cell wall biosynthesis
MTSPTVTVCVPSIGRMAYLPQVREALSAQTIGDIEIIVLDNASGDEARAFFADWLRADPRVRVERVDDRLPMFVNFERGRRLARGTYLAYCHDDDVYLPRWLEGHVAALERHPDAAFAGSNFDTIDETGRVVDRRRWIARDERMPGTTYLREVMRRGRNLVTMQGLVYRRSSLLEPMFDESISCHFGDFVILMRMAESGSVALVSEVLLQVRRHAEQASAGKPISEELGLRVPLMRDYLRELSGRPPGNPPLMRALEADLERSIVVASMWGWWSAASSDEAALCRDALRATRRGADLAPVLALLDSVGIRDHLRRMSPLVRRIGNTLKV